MLTPPDRGRGRFELSRHILVFSALRSTYLLIVIPLVIFFGLLLVDRLLPLRLHAVLVITFVLVLLVLATDFVAWLLNLVARPGWAGLPLSLGESIVGTTSKDINLLAAAWRSVNFDGGALAAVVALWVLVNVLRLLIEVLRRHV